jgi:hypothetical protein
MHVTIQFIIFQLLFLISENLKINQLNGKVFLHKMIYGQLVKKFSPLWNRTFITTPSWASFIQSTS